MTEVLKFETVACDACGSPNSKLLYRFYFNREAANIVECDSCSHVYLSPRPRPTCIADFYGKDYYSFFVDPMDDTNPKNSKDKLRRTIMKNHFGYSKIDVTETWPIPSAISRLLKPFVAVPYFRENGRLLDVGCGAGQKMVEFKSLGWGVCGVELSSEAADAGRNLGLEVVTTPLTEAPWPEAHFTAITFYHSLEHMPSPREALRDAFRLMAPGGELLVAVPNFGCLERKLFGKNWDWLDVPVHFHHFTKATLTRMIAATGFRIETVGFSPFGSSARLPFFDRLPLARPLADKAVRLFGIVCALTASGKALIVCARKSGASPMNSGSRLCDPFRRADKSAQLAARSS